MGLLENLRYRSEQLYRLRSFFRERNFVEVQTPVLSADTVVDQHVEPIAVTDSSFPPTQHGGQTYYLRTSPEFAMKRLLSAGMEAIYEIGTVFRQGERGQFHNVEFTMLEWYRVGDNYQAGMNLLAELIRFIDIDKMLPEVVYCSFGDIFRQYTGVNPHRATAAEYREVAVRQHIPYPDSLTETMETEDWIDLLFSELVQPNLQSAIVYDFPATQSQLAQTRIITDTVGAVAVSERYELFLNGIEVANGYHELLDATELRQRFRKNLRQRLAAKRRELPIESRLLTAMELGLPASCGTALGVDRLLMVLLHANSIDDVLPFPIETC
ncbi:MAG: EF-P lysine aminoacylase GenX [Planctomycetaceae bacterium]|jgi:lysyl-tRNA synthetase class 2|nr:EF-P lysine aminoacylase GenX [Planctomycetaceae bacterium]